MPLALLPFTHLDFNVAIVTSVTPNILSVQEIQGYRKDGRRCAKVKEVQQMLVFFQQENHYSVAVPDA